jgi:transposase-like protein
METKFDADELNLVLLAKKFSNENRARKLFEKLRWPNGKPVCPHCKNDGNAKPISKLTAKAGSRVSVRKGVYFCGACRKPFTATVGTVFEDSHVPLSKILMASFIICSSKKSVSAMQLSRMLKTTYRTSWFLAHRIRHAMATDLKTAKPLDNTCEADETFMPNFEKPERKTCVALIVERNGEARTRVIPSVTAKNIGEFMAGATRKTATVNTDEHAAYKLALKGYKRHDRVNHGRYEYARHNPDGTVSHVNTCESFFSLLKRGVYGSWHCISAEHLSKYASEFEFRWNTRHETDGQRMANFLPLISGKRLLYRQPAK